MGKEEKQFPLTSKENCCIYLNRIISSCEICMDSLKKYNSQLGGLIEQFKGQDLIPFDLYCEIRDKSYNILSYLVNLLGDCQTSSISYFKYRQQIAKRVKKGNTDIPLYNISDDDSILLAEFNKNRNWMNHVPESLLVAEMELVNAGIAKFPMDPVEITCYEYVTFGYVNHLYLSNSEFYTNARRIIQVAKREYAMLFGKSVTYPRVYADKPLGMEKSEAVKKSAKVQGLKGELE